MGIGDLVGDPEDLAVLRQLPLDILEVERRHVGRHAFDERGRHGIEGDRAPELDGLRLVLRHGFDIGREIQDDHRIGGLQHFLRGVDLGPGGDSPIIVAGNFGHDGGAS